MGKSTKRTLKWQYPSRVISLRRLGNPFPLMPLLISVLSLQDIPWSWKHRTQLTSSFPGRKWWLTSIWNAELSRTTPRKTRESLPLIYPGEESPLPRHLFPLLPKSTWPCQLWAVHRGDGLGCEAGQESIPLLLGKTQSGSQKAGETVESVPRDLVQAFLALGQRWAVLQKWFLYLMEVKCQSTVFPHHSW